MNNVTITVGTEITGKDLLMELDLGHCLQPWKYYEFNIKVDLEEPLPTFGKFLPSNSTSFTTIPELRLLPTIRLQQ